MKGKIEAIDKDTREVTIKGKKYIIGKAKWNSENLKDKLDIDIEIEYDIKGANFDFKKICYYKEISINNNRNNVQRNFGKNNIDLKNEIFFYPYNFVSIDENVSRDKFEIGEYSGKLKCSFINRSPLFYPAIKNKEKSKGHSKEEFNLEDGYYVIPGSSLKGSVRSVLEAISNSCILNIETERLEKRINAGGFKGVCGIIKRLPTEKEDGLIVGAEVVKVKISALDEKYTTGKSKIIGREGIYEISLSNEIKNFERIEKKEEFRRVTQGKQDIKGCLWISSNIYNKEKEKIIYTKSTGKSYKFTWKEYKDIMYLLDQRNAREDKNNKNFYLKDLKVGDPIIFQTNMYDEAENLAFSEIPRLRYKYSPYDLLPKELQSCENNENACYACRIFGMTGNNNEEKKEEDKDKISLQGRVFFKDGKIKKSIANIQNKPICIKSLGTPHPTLTSFYLENGTYDDKGAQIRGRKFYWHHRDKIDKDTSTFLKSIEAKQEENHNSSIQFMNHGNKFEFEVTFKNLKEDELGLLLLSLELEKGMLHKFGKAKALGFGSCEVTIDKLLLDSKNKYDSFEEPYIESKDKDKFIEKFKKTFKLEGKKQWKDLQIIMNEKNNLDFSNSPFPEKEDKKGNKNTLEWFNTMKKQKNFRLPKIEDYK